MVNQLLAGVHIAASAEAMAFGARLGLNTRILFEVITNSRGTSWYFYIFCVLFHYIHFFFPDWMIVAINLMPHNLVVF